MNASGRRVGRTLWTACRAVLALTAILGIGYTFAITGVGQLLFPAQADGSPVTNRSGAIVGSALLGQSFTDRSGRPLPEYFQPRPSNAGDGYDAAASSGSNLGPEHPELIRLIGERRAQVAAFDGVAESEVPADAVTSSGSGLDPDISPAYAEIQVRRVAEARGLSERTVRDLVTRHTRGRDLGFLGEPTVDVLGLNLELDELGG